MKKRLCLVLSLALLSVLNSSFIGARERGPALDHYYPSDISESVLRPIQSPSAAIIQNSEQYLARLDMSRAQSNLATGEKRKEALNAAGFQCDLAKQGGSDSLGHEGALSESNSAIR